MPMAEGCSKFQDTRSLVSGLMSLILKDLKFT